MFDSGSEEDAVAPVRKAGLMQPGDDLIYRERETAASERVILVKVQERKRSPRLEVEFTRGERAGTRAWVPGNRVYGPWRDVEAFDARMAGLEQLRANDDLTEIESYAVDDVYRLLLPTDVAETVWNPVRHATRVLDRERLERLVQTDVAALLAPFPTVEDNGNLLVSPNGSSAIAEALCRAEPDHVSEWILEEEQRRSVWTKRGKPAGADGGSRGSTAAWEWRMYRETHRPIYELMRSWAGHRAVTAQERRVAAEAEVHRLEQLALRLIDSLREFRPEWATDLTRELLDEAITVQTIRPLVERPLDPSEAQVRVEYRSRRWGH